MSLSHFNLRSDLLEEYSTLEYILLGDLRDLLYEPPDEETCRWLLAVLDALLETLPREFDLKQQDGYLMEVLAGRIFANTPKTRASRHEMLPYG